MRNKVQVRVLQLAPSMTSVLSGQGKLVCDSRCCHTDGRIQIDLYITAVRRGETRDVTR